MPSAEYERFLESMKIGYMQWHDGDGYDLEVLARLSPGEREDAEAALLDHLKFDADWRDVEALHALGTDTARAAVRGACQHRKSDIRRHAVALVGDESEKEAEIVLGLKSRNFHDVSRALDMAVDCRTEPVKAALLSCAHAGDREARVNAAAMLMYLCGKAAAPFDWEQRPFFLRFGSDDAREVESAWRELQERTTGT